MNTETDTATMEPEAPPAFDHSATYSPEDNKIRITAAFRLPRDQYDRLKSAGFSWAPRQEIFVAPMWTPDREDIALEFCGEIGDEDSSLVERATDRADRFKDYSHSRAADADAARRAVSAIADHIPLGQPILVGHHSEKRARRDAGRIQAGMERAVRMWDTAQYWKQRAAGAIRAAKYKERPDVRARRIKKIEADQRKQERVLKELQFQLKFWTGQMPRKVEFGGGFMEVNRENVLRFANYHGHESYCWPLAQYPRPLPASQYEGAMSIWGALGGSDGPEHAVCTVQQAAQRKIPDLEAGIDRAARWMAHYQNRLEYERAMLGEQGGTIADKTGPQKGGAVRCWASSQAGGWSYIVKVNKVSVTILDQWSHSQAAFTRTIEFDKLKAVMTPEQVETARAEGLIMEHAGPKGEKIGFALLGERPKAAPVASPEPDPRAEDFAKLKEAAAVGVKVVSAPQLFPTPPELAARMIDVAKISPGQRVLEPSAGTGELTSRIISRGFLGFECGGKVVAVEINGQLCEALRERSRKTLYSTDENFSVFCGDFLQNTPLDPDGGPALGLFDRVVMNPPFKDAADIAHIRHAFTFLKPGGRLVAICANGPRQQAQLAPWIGGLGGTWEPLPAGSFTASGTDVSTVLLALTKS